MAMRKEIIQYEMSNHFVRLFPCSSMSDTAIADEIRSSHFHRELETHRPIVDANTSNRARFAIIGMNQSRRDYPREHCFPSGFACHRCGGTVTFRLFSLDFDTYVHVRIVSVPPSPRLLARGLASRLLPPAGTTVVSCTLSLSLRS